MVDISQEPYFDDFDEDKGFHKILFVPARAVQVREMTQIQTMIQNQISKFGDHIFENGSLVIPGELNFNLEYSFAKINIADFETVKDQLANQGVTVTGQSSGVTADLVEAIDAEDTDPVTLYVKYTNGGTSGDLITFTDSETVDIKNSLGNTISTATIISTGLGSNLTINEGVYYVNGYFVKTEKQSIILDKYSTTPSYKIGFLINEDEVTFSDDASLLDNASGSTNFTAPGANRLRIKLDLVKLDIGEDNLSTDEFVEIFRIKEGNVQRKARGPEYNIIEDVLAQRTFDESGDYTVEPFTIDILEHLDDGENDGVFLPVDGGDESKFVVAVEQGRAYVRGYEVENETTRYISVDKARDTDVNNNGAFSAPLGYYIEIEGLNRLPDMQNMDEIQFYDANIVTNGTAAGTLLGTANVRSFAKTSDPNFFALHIFNIRDLNGDANSSFVAGARSVYAAGSPAFTADIFESNLGDISIKQPTDQAGVFLLPNANVKTLLDGGQSDTSFDIIRQYSLTTDGSGVVNMPSAGSNEIYASQNDLYSFISIPSTEEVLTISGITTLSGSPTGKEMTINLGAGYESVDVIVNVIVTKQIATQKSKTATTRIVQGTLDVDNRLSLERADCYEIISVLDANDQTDYTERFKLVQNKTPTYYGVSYIELDPAFSAPPSTIDVEYRYFQHGVGDYFSVDSYSGIDYADIPTETIAGQEISLADVLDFRPTYANDGSDFAGTGSSISLYPVPSSTIRADIEYYLPRIDKVFVDFEGNFGVKKGESSLNPNEPNDPDAAMVIYTLDVPAYTADATEINSQFVNNRRYTMRDIGKLEKRIENVEYYTILNNLEKATSDQQIVDPQTGLNRFKNGFAADPFVDHSVGDFTNQDYKCSVSTEDKELRSEFSTDVVDMTFNTGSSSGVIEHENLITLDYTEEAYIEQLKASSTMNINPYAVFRWVGGVKLIPNSDVWVDTKYTTPKVTNKTVSNLGNLNQWWRSWVLRWAGSKRSGGVSRQTTTEDRSFFGFDTITTRNVNASISTSNRVVGERVVDTDVVPFMRSRDVQFQGKGLKPSSRIFCFFDDVDVNAYCKPSGGSFGDAIYTDANGDVTGTFKIPNDNTQRFRTGSKKFVVTDESENNRQLSLSYAETEYSAKGLLETKQRSILSTRTITASQTINRSLNLETNRFAVRRDPLAQSFYVEKDGGMFITSIDVFFSTKDDNAPVTLQIREMVNGQPGPKIVPYSETVLNPSEVSTSTDASVSTTFTFSDPLYLKNETEYCIVLLANSISYNVYVAGLGEKDITTNLYISKQPYSGVLFKSENNSTWTADQTKDLTFRINRAVFNTTTDGNVEFDSQDSEQLILESNPLQTTDASTTVVAKIPNHGLFVGSQFAISGAVTGNGIPANELNTTHTATNIINNNEVEFEVTTSATDTGLIGGASVISDRNYVFDDFTPMFEELNFNGTTTTYSASGTTGKSIDGTETAYASDTYPTNIILKDNHSLKAPWVVPSSTDNAANNLSQTAFTINGVMSSEKDSVSPVIDKNRIGMIVVNNIINSPSSLSELTSVGGNAISRYITKPIGLKDAATSIKTFVDANRPQGSNIHVYYRVGSTNEEVIASDWTEFDTVIEPAISDSDSFNEAEFEAESIGSFSVFQIKVVMVSTSSSNIPKVKNFRSIALGT
ncbi:MAG: DUF4815 domain-containing protein [Nitrosopumilaceae archaeon]|nr:DUF4815 domain-containing protein [Nitrosopumilaceae archaeon]